MKPLAPKFDKLCFEHIKKTAAQAHALEEEDYGRYCKTLGFATNGLMNLVSCMATMPGSLMSAFDLFHHTYRCMAIDFIYSDYPDRTEYLTTFDEPLLFLCTKVVTLKGITDLQSLRDGLVSISIKTVRDQDVAHYKHFMRRALHFLTEFIHRKIIENIVDKVAPAHVPPEIIRRIYHATHDAHGILREHDQSV
jgi:hypothetical protein